jgi:hypothetical protein
VNEQHAPLSQDRGYVRRRGPNRKGVLTLEAVTTLYEAGHTQDEIAKQLDVSQYKVWYFMRAHGLKTRPQIKRDQTGDRNHVWTGDKASYLAAHKRVYRTRGKPRLCEHCGANDERMYHWANVTGRYTDVSDYVRVCVPCHRAFDAARRVMP